MNLTKTSSSHALVLCNKQILLILRDDIPTIASPGCWSLPGGVIEPGESPEAAMIRELSEEVNLSTTNAIFIGSQKKTNDSIRHLFLLEISPEQKKSLKLGNEGQKYSFFTIEELPSLKLTRNIHENLDIIIRHIKNSGSTLNKNG